MRISILLVSLALEGLHLGVTGSALLFILYQFISMFHHFFEHTFMLFEMARVFENKVLYELLFLWKMMLACIAAKLSSDLG